MVVCTTMSIQLVEICEQQVADLPQVEVSGAMIEKGLFRLRNYSLYGRILRRVATGKVISSAVKPASATRLSGNVCAFDNGSQWVLMVDETEKHKLVRLWRKGA